MPITISASTPIRTITIDLHTDGTYAALGMEHPDILEIAKSVTAIHENTPLTTITLKQVGSMWKLTIIRADGLKWRDDYRIDPDTNKVQIQTNVNQWWLFQDAAPLRRFRDILTKLLASNTLH